MKNTSLDKIAKEYILNAIDSEAYDVETATDKDKLQFLRDTFTKEYAHEIKRQGEFKAFSEWVMGLPSCFNVDFENYKILEIAKKWGSIPKDATEKQEDKILENWWNFITNKTFQLFRKHKTTNKSLLVA